MEKNLVKQGTEVTFIIPTVEELGQLSKMSPNFSLTLKYKTADDWAVLKDKELRAYYMGFKEIPNKDGELIKCGLFVTETECFLSGSYTLMDAVRRLESNTAVSITYRGKRPNKKTEGATMIFEVKTLK